MDICRTVDPVPREIGPDRQVACHLYDPSIRPAGNVPAAHEAPRRRGKSTNKESQDETTTRAFVRRSRIRRSARRDGGTRQRRAPEHSLLAGGFDHEPYLSGGTKDIEAASLVIEPLARFDHTGTIVPFLAQDIPTVQNGGVSEDLTTITWKLKKACCGPTGRP